MTQEIEELKKGKNAMQQEIAQLKQETKVKLANLDD